MTFLPWHLAFVPSNRPKARWPCPGLSIAHDTGFMTQYSQSTCQSANSDSYLARKDEKIYKNSRNSLFLFPSSPPLGLHRGLLLTSDSLCDVCNQHFMIAAENLFERSAGNASAPDLSTYLYLLYLLYFLVPLSIGPTGR